MLSTISVFVPKNTAKVKNVFVLIKKMAKKDKKKFLKHKAYTLSEVADLLLSAGERHESEHGA